MSPTPLQRHNRRVTRIRAWELASTEGPFGRGEAPRRPDEVPEGSVVTVLRVPPELAGMRLDRFVQGEMKRTSRTRARAIIEKSAYSPEGKRLRPNMRVRGEQHVHLWRAPWDEHAPDVTIAVLYEDDHYLAVDKPPGIPVHPTARYHASTVVKMLESARPGEHLRLSHRIDRETSGVLMLAKTSEADRLIKAQFEARDGITKRYVAITWGAPSEDTFRVELPLELDPTSRYAVKMRVARPGTGLWAATAFETLERRFHRETGQTYALIKCTLETGRQHQIRVHLASLGLPLVGDKLYGPDEGLFARGADHELTDDDRARLEIDRHALHAAELVLVHPIHRETITIKAPLPPDLASFWAGLTTDPPATRGSGSNDG